MTPNSVSRCCYRSPVVVGLAGLALAATAVADSYHPRAVTQGVQAAKARAHAGAGLPDPETVQPGADGERFTRAARRLRIFHPDSVVLGIKRIRWSYVADGTPMETSPPSDFGQGGPDPLPNENPRAQDFQSKLFARLNGRVPPFGFANDGAQPRWQQMVLDAFNSWQQVTGIEFVFVPEGTDPVADNPNGDSGDRWDQNAPSYPDLTTQGIGDIRIAMADLDGTTSADGLNGAFMAYTYAPTIISTDSDSMGPPGDAVDMTDPMDLVQNLGYWGNIILDEDEQWNDAAYPNLFATVIAREIGFALGALPACPARPESPFALLQEQFMAAGPDDPLPQLFFQEPQQDDIRAIQYLWGDTFDFNEVFALATLINYESSPASGTFTFAPHLALPSTQFAFPVQLSISGGVFASGPDIFRLVLPDSVIDGEMTITVEPAGTPYIDGTFDPGSSTCNLATLAVDPRIIHNLSMTLHSFDAFSGSLFEVDMVNLAPAGGTEVLTAPVSAGIYFITVQGSGANDVQLYNMSIVVERPLPTVGDEVGPIVETGIGAGAFGDLGFFGSGAAFASVDGQHFASLHDAFSDRTVQRINWPGIDPAVTTSASHATSVAGAGAGKQIGAFQGVAPGAELYSASVATQVFPDGSFQVGKTAFYFALFALSDPDLSRGLLPSPASVICSAWSGGSTILTGDDPIAQAFDAAVSMTGVTIVSAAGNNGTAERRGFPNCPRGAGADTLPGARFLGSRSVISPASAFNVISVGAVGSSDGAAFDIVANFSSRGPVDSALFDANGTITPDTRSGIDIVAPGAGFTNIPPDFTPLNGPQLDPCLYRGPLPVNYLSLPSIDATDDPENPADPGFFGPAAGTSVAAAMVAGGLALLQDSAGIQDPPLSTHPAVLKALLLNGAIKLPGWTNNVGLNIGKPQDQRDGFNPGVAGQFPVVYPAARPLDIAQGAGLMDLERSLENYLTGYPPAIPPQAFFAGPTIDPTATDPTVPTITIPIEPPVPGNPPGRMGDDSEENWGSTTGDRAQAAPEPTEYRSPIEIANILRGARGGVDEPSVFFGRSLQDAGNRDPDLKLGRGPGGTGFLTGPQTPFLIPKLGGGDDDDNPTGGPPGSIDPGVRPREIDPILVDPIGWDHANIDQRAIRLQGNAFVTTGYIDYLINVPLLAVRPDPRDPMVDLPPDEFTITLCWLRKVNFKDMDLTDPAEPRLGTLNRLELENLDLEWHQTTDPEGRVPPNAVPLLPSNSLLGNVEHIAFPVTESGMFVIRVRWVGTSYDLFFNEPAAEQQYGLAWRVDFSPRPVVGLRSSYSFSDIMNVLASWGGRIGNSAYVLSSDVNVDGRIDINDIIGILANWSAYTPPR